MTDKDKLASAIASVATLHGEFTLLSGIGLRSLFTKTDLTLAASGSVGSKFAPAAA